jgi:1,4-alpha-glucan branching enzyme
MMKNLLNLIFLFLAPILLGAQVVSVSPPFPSQNDTVTIIFDASEGNGALSGFVPVYTHTGIITAAAGPGNWQNVQGNWGTADPNVIMTPLGNNKHSISYHIPTFYNIGTGTIVTELSFVFRNSNGNTVGRAADGSDIFYPIYPANSGLLAAFLSPNQTQITGVLQSSVISSRSINTSFSAGAAGLHTVELVADDGSTIVRDTVYYVVNSAVQTLAVPANTEYGINYLSPSSLRLKLHAPFKNYVYVIGDFNNWEANPNYFMHKDPNGTDWWIDISNLSPGDRYSFQYWVDGDIKVADPYSELVLDPWNDDFIDAQTYPNPHPYPTGKTTGITSLIHMDKPTFNWQNSNFLPPNKDELIIYELHLRDFIANHNYQTLIDTLDYLERLGINAIELMPVNEFEGNESWGYNPSFHMALDKYYGTPEKLKEFVDTCHGRGIAVFLDVVLNHAFSQSPLVQLYWDPSAGSFGEPTAQNPWMNTSPKHDFNVGYDFNHESQASQDFAERIMKYWVSEYKVDGYRMDLSKGFTQNNTLGNVAAWGVYDQSRINILTRLKNQMESAQPNSYMILEHFAANNEELELSNKGFMIWGNMHYNYNEAAMGYISNSDFSGAFHSQRGWTNKHLIAYQESHDEERITFSLLNYGNSSGSYNTQSLATALARKELTSLFLYTIPGPKMLWQFGELGYDIGINDPCRICNKPLLWSYQQDANRARLYTVVSNILNLRTSYPVFNTNNYRYSLNGTTKRINLDDPAINATVIGNFDVIAQDVNPNFQNSGLWYEFFSGDSINVNNTNALINLQAGEYRLYTTQKVVVDNSIGIGTNPLFSNGFTSYPNPADNTLYIDFTEAALRDKVKLNIFNITGQKVLELENAKIIQERRSYNISSLKPGTYLIRLETSKTLKQDRLIVE